MVSWTEEQQTAITASGSDILVAAAAGSGKTAVLVERIIQKVVNKQDPIDIDEILVATFTNAAAEEMRNRIGLALEAAIEKEPASYHLKKQLSLLQRASISTLHAFCTTVVRQYAYLLDLDPSFRIADEMEIDMIQQEVLDDLLEDAYSREGESLEAFFAVVDMFSSDRSDAAVGELILQLYQFARENPWPEKWLEEVAEAYHLPENCEEADLPWLQVLKTAVQDELQIFEQHIQQAIAIAREPDGPYHYLEALEADLLLIDTALKNIGEWNRVQQIVHSSKLKSLSRKKVECDEAKKEQIKHIRASFRDGWNKLSKSWFSRSLENHLDDMQTLYPVVKELTQLTIDFKQRFSSAKREKVIVDFSDLEHFCLAILIESSSTKEHIIPSAIAKQYKKQFKEILIDEYQDINIVQETILSVVSDQEGKGNLFMVGDVKQSIYRFRHAEPTLFIQKYKRFTEEDSKGLRIDLAKNFRSREDVLTGANYIFRQVFDESFGEVAYDESAELVYGNVSYDEHPNDHSKTELIVLDRDQEEAEERTEDGENAEDLLHTQLEARLYADKIKEWIGQKGDAPLQVIDKGTNQKRDIQYRDIVILQRSLTGSSIIVDELKKQGIPVYAELRSGYFAAIEIQVMVNMLKIIDNPFQDIPLASVLRSPIVGLQEDELTQIRLANKQASYYEALLDYVEKEENPVIQAFLQQLADFQLLAKQGALSELIWEIFRETGYYDFVGGIPGGRQRQANLRALYDRARGYENTSFRGLFRFLRFIERMEKRKKDLGEARALSEQEDVVRMMTIHKSKGLEFPIVIIGGMHKQFNFTDLRSSYMLDKDLGFATKFIDPIKRITYPTLYYIALQQSARQKLLAEEMRVLYVAMTRAKEKLVMIGNVPVMEKLIKAWEGVLDHNAWVLPTEVRKKAKTYLDWVGPALIRHKDNDVLRREETSGIWQNALEDVSSWQVHIVRASTLMNRTTELETEKDEWQKTITEWNQDALQDTGHYDKVDDILSFQYPHKEASETRAKESVTEIKRRQEQIDVYSDQQFLKPFRAPLVKRPRFLQEDTSLSATEIGTAMHAVMQHIPLEGEHDPVMVTDFVAQLVMEEKLTEKEAETIDVHAISRFFSTEMFQMMSSGLQVEREIPFTYTLDVSQVYPNWQGAADEKVLIQGVVDCLIHTEDGLIILDYKTDAISGEVTDKTIMDLKIRYATQIALYKQALEDILQQKVQKSYLYFFSKDILLEI